MIGVHVLKTISLYVFVYIYIYLYISTNAQKPCMVWMHKLILSYCWQRYHGSLFSKAGNPFGCCNKVWKVNTHIHYDHIMGNYGFSVAPGRRRCRGICQGSKCRTFSENWKVGEDALGVADLCIQPVNVIMCLFWYVVCAVPLQANSLQDMVGASILDYDVTDVCLQIGQLRPQVSCVLGTSESSNLSAHSRISMNFRLFEFGGALGTASQTPLNSGALWKFRHDNLPALRIGLMKAAEFFWMKTVQLKENHWRFCTLRGTLLILSPCDLAAHQKHGFSKCSERHIMSILDRF